MPVATHCTQRYALVLSLALACPLVGCGSSGNDAGNTGGSSVSSGGGAAPGASGSAGLASAGGSGGSSSALGAGAPGAGGDDASGGMAAGGVDAAGGASVAGMGSLAGDGSVAGMPNGGGTSTDKLAAKPYLGWSSWSSLVANPTETKIKAITDAMAQTLLSYGYQYINIDDGWYSGIDANGYWKTNTARIPSGIEGLADYVHGKGMKLGLYMVPGLLNASYDANATIVGTAYKTQSIAGSGAGNTNKKENAAHKIDYSKPGAVEFVQGQANLFASWGVDFIKMDFVGPGGGGGSADNQEDIKQWRAALDKTGRQIWLELSNQLDIAAIATWKGYSNGWRIASDIEVYSGKRTDWAHLKREMTALPPFVQHAGPGHWNDMDSTEIGNGDTDGISATERQTQFSYWAINCAPIYLGTDPTSFDADDLKILQNKEVIAVHQAGVPAKPVSTATTAQVWYSNQADGSVVVGLFNLGDGAAMVSAAFSAIGAGSTMKVRDLVSQTDLGASTTSYGASVPAHGSRLLRLTP
jgi:alpha-galactosidase